MNDELDSQLSAMFDDELPAAECELLARRLSRDEQLKARWGRYAVMGAAIRAEGGVRLTAGLARRVSLAISSEPALVGQSAVRRSSRFAAKWWQPFAGAAVAAGVAMVSILWMRSQSPAETMVADAAAPASALSRAGIDSRVVASMPDSYVVPPASERPAVLVPNTELANYVVAHSEFSSPVARRNLLSALIASESGTAGTSAGSDETLPPEETQDDAKNVQ